MNKKIFLDYAATTPIRREVAQVIIDEYLPIEENDSALDYEQQTLKLISAKKNIAKLLGCVEDNICLTSCGSESNNAIIKAVAYALPNHKKHLITTEIEHPSVLNVFKQLEKEGFEVTYLKVDSKGQILLTEFYKSVIEGTGLVSTMFFNNEVGSRQPVEVIGNFLKQKGIFYHVDGIQAVYNEVFEVSKLPIDAMSFSAHKLYGPKGIGGLYINDDQFKIVDNIRAYLPYSEHSKLLIYTENTPFVMGFSKACEIAYRDRVSHIEHLKYLRAYFINEIKKINANVKVNAMDITGHPGIINIMLPSIDADSAMINLDMMGYAVSTGSACSSGALSASHVLLAMGLSEKEAKRSIRISLGDYTTHEDVNGFIQALKMQL